jgi:hypothetical protein
MQLCGGQTKALRTLAELSQRFLTGCVEHSQFLRQRGRHLLQQRRFADARITAEKDNSARHESTAEHPVKLRKPGCMALRQVIRQ